MLNKSEEKRNQIQMFCIEDLVPKDHLLRKIEKTITIMEILHRAELSRRKRIETIIADAGYRTSAIAKLLIDDGIKPLLPYKRPQTKKDILKSMTMLTTNTSTVIYVQIKKY